LCQQLQLNPVAEHVPEKDVTFLDSCCFPRRYAQTGICQCGQLSSSFSGHANCEGSERTRALDCVADIRAVSGGRKPDQHVSTVTESLHLAREDRIKSEVVCDRSENRCVGGQRDGGPATPFATKAPDYLGGKML